MKCGQWGLWDFLIPECRFFFTDCFELYVSVKMSADDTSSLLRHKVPPPGAGDLLVCSHVLGPPHLLWLLITKTSSTDKPTHAFTCLNPSELAVCCHEVNGPSSTFDWVVCFRNVSQDTKKTKAWESLYGHHFPTDKSWRWNDESWNDMISLAESGSSRQKWTPCALPWCLYPLNPEIMTLPC